MAPCNKLVFETPAEDLETQSCINKPELIREGQAKGRGREKVPTPSYK